MVTTPRFQMTWYQAPVGTHAVSAAVQLQSSLGGYLPSAAINSPNVQVSVLVKPDLAAYQTSATDLQIPGPGLSLSLSRTYSSRDTNVMSALGRGWKSSWDQASLVLSSDLSTNWQGVLQTALGYQTYNIGDAGSHCITITLPGGQCVLFAPQVACATDFNPDLGDVTVDMSFAAYQLGAGTLSCPNSAGLTVVSDDSTDWNTRPLQLSGIIESSFVYRDLSGTSYLFLPNTNNPSGLAWRLASVSDRNGNCLSNVFNANGTLAAMVHSCGRSLGFVYTNANEINVLDCVALAGTSSPPVLKYVLDANQQLVQVRCLVNRAGAGTYLTNAYAYGGTDSGNSAAAQTNRLTDIYDPRGVRTLHVQYLADNPPLGYVSDGDVATQTDATGATTAYLLNQYLNLTVTRTNALGQTTTAQVQHNAGGAIAGVSQPTTNGVVGAPATQCAYTANGQVASQADAYGNTKNFAYDDQGRLISQSDELGNGSAVSYGNYSLAATTTDANHNTTYNTYDAAGNLVSTINPTGAQTTYAYYPATATLPELLQTESRVAGYTIVTGYTYTPTGDTLTTTEKWVDQAGNLVGAPVTTAYTYDGNGNRTTESKTRSLPGGTQTVTTTYTYDAQNRVIQTVLSASGGGQSFTAQTNSTLYNNLGKQAYTTNAAGYATAYVYDAPGNLIETRYPDGTVSRTAYDANNRSWIVQDRTAGNGSGPTTNCASRTTYDASGRAVLVERLAAVTLQKTNAASGQPYMAASNLGTTVSSTQTYYDAVGRVQFAVDARGTTNAPGYDAAGRQIAVTNAFGTALQTVTWYGYDPNGNQVAVTNALGAVTLNTYDAANRLTRVQFLGANGGLLGTRYTGYDNLGRRVSETNEAGITTTFGYDFRGLLTAVTLDANHSGPTTTYSYDEAGNLTAQTNANGHTTTFVYDAAGRRLQRVLPGGQSETFAYDVLGNLVLHTNFNAVVITNVYDLANRLTNTLSTNGFSLVLGLHPHRLADEHDRPERHHNVCLRLAQPADQQER